MNANKEVIRIWDRTIATLINLHDDEPDIFDQLGIKVVVVACQPKIRRVTFEDRGGEAIKLQYIRSLDCWAGYSPVLHVLVIAEKGTDGLGDYPEDYQ